MGHRPEVPRSAVFEARVPPVVCVETEVALHISVERSTKLVSGQHPPPVATHGKPVGNSAGTLQLNNRRLIGCLISFTRSAEFNRSRLLDLLEKPKSKSF